MQWASIFWKTGFVFMLFSLSVFFGYLWAVFGSISDILSSVKDLIYALTLNLVRGVGNIEGLLKRIDQMLKRFSDELPDLLEDREQTHH